MDSLYDFENWLKENNLFIALSLVKKYRKEKNKPKEDLIRNCGWITNHLNLFGVDGINFTETEIKDLQQKGYNFTVYSEIDRGKHYLNPCLDYDYYITVTIYKGEERIIELSSQVDYDDYYRVLKPFEENVQGESKVIGKE